MPRPFEPRMLIQRITLLATVCSLSLFAAASVRAAITTAGSANPTAPTDGDDLFVGDEQASSPSILGVFTINGGSSLALDKLVAGDEQEYIGNVTVTGAGTYLELTDSGASDPALQVGDQGTGFMSIASQATVDVSSNSGNVVVGRQATGLGTLSVDGSLTQLIVGEDLIVGDEGFGEMTISDGALVYHTDPVGGTAVIGAAATGVGLVEVSGDYTYWQLPQTTTIGVTGVGALRIGTGATVDGDNDFGTTSTTTIGTNGEVEMMGGRLLVESLTNNGRIEGSGYIQGPVTNASTGEIGVGPGQVLQFTGDVDNTGGLINVSGDADDRAELQFLGSVTNTDPGGASLAGRIAVGDGIVRFNQPLTNDGTIASTSGVTDFHGEITNGAAGLIAIGGQSNATFYDDVDVSAGTFNIAAGSTALFLGDISISAGVTVDITLDESALNEGFSTPLQVAGLTTLNTPITLSLSSDFTPELGDSFELIAADGGFAVGVINPNNFDPLPTGLLWDLQLTDGGLTAVVINDGINPGGGVLDGDYNGDDIVDSADYTVWRDQLGLTGAGLAADGDGNGIVNADDYLVWRDNFGSFASSGPTLVPEPSSLLLIASVLLAGTNRRTARR